MKTKLKFLLERGAKIFNTVHHFEMPSGDKGTIDNFDCVHWSTNPPPATLNNELNQLLNENQKLHQDKKT